LPSISFGVADMHLKENGNATADDNCASL
jgi:hypothetical protein